MKDLGNLIKHLRTHDESKDWVKSYCESRGSVLATKLTLEEFKLSKFFITSNLGLRQLSNPCLDILEKSITNCSYYKFRNIVLPSVANKLHNELGNKLAELYLYV